MRYKWLFFDLDGTIWDFPTNSEIVLKLLLKQLTPHLVEQEQEFLDLYHKYNDILWVEYGHGNITKEVLRRKRFADALSHFAVTDDSIITHFSEQYITMAPYQTHLMPNAIEVLDYLKQKGYRLYLLTNGFAEIQHIKITKSGLTGYFEKVFTSDEMGYKKPHKLAFDYAVKYVNARKRESLMIGDEWPTDIEGAQRAGIDQVYYHTKNKPPQGQSTFVITNLLELKQIL